MGDVAFSPKLGILGKRVQVWNVVVRYKTQHKGNQHIIKRKAKNCGIQNPLNTSLTEAQRGKKVAKQRYNDVKLFARFYRDEFLRNKIRGEKNDKKRNKIKEVL